MATRGQNAETALLSEIMLAIGAMSGIRVWRNNTGGLKTSTGRVVRYGLGPGSPDLIAIQSVTVTQDMVGEQIGVFTTIEVKTKQGAVSKAQKNFIDVIKKFGGNAFVARSVNDALKGLGLNSRSL